MEPEGVEVLDLLDGEVPEGTKGAILVLSQLGWHPRLRRWLAATPPSQRPLTALWHIEPLPPSRASGLPWEPLSWREHWRILRRNHRATDIYTNSRILLEAVGKQWLDLVITSTRGRQEYLRENGVPAEWVPIGLLPSYGRPLDKLRDIDVLFLGDLRVPRRQRFFRQLRRAGIAVDARGDFNDPKLYGEHRTQLLNRVKIFLNFPKSGGELSGLRNLIGMVNKTLLISEPIYRPEPYLPGVHFEMCPVEEMPDLIRHYLQHEEQRLAMVERAYQFATTEMLFGDKARDMLRLIRQAVDRRYLG
jgi:hypothetical protein